MNALPLFDGIGRCAAPASLAEMRAATETGLRRLQAMPRFAGAVRSALVRRWPTPLAAILSVDYRLAPEYPFPQPLEDVYQALCWVAQQAPQLGIDAQRSAVGGDSAPGKSGGGGRCWRGIAAARTSSASCCCTRRSAARWRRRAIASLPRALSDARRDGILLAAVSGPAARSRRRAAARRHAARVTAGHQS